MEVWRRRWEPPPRLRSEQLLRHLIAWRMQAEALGGLDPETRRLLRRPGVSRRLVLKDGQCIIREWKGMRHEVTVLDGRYIYQGAAYRSLSQVARAITGVHWNGPRFFGLRRRA